MGPKCDLSFEPMHWLWRMYLWSHFRHKNPQPTLEPRKTTQRSSFLDKAANILLKLRLETRCVHSEVFSLKHCTITDSFISLIIEHVLWGCCPTGDSLVSLSCWVCHVTNNNLQSSWFRLKQKRPKKWFFSGSGPVAPVNKASRAQGNGSQPELTLFNMKYRQLRREPWVNT